MNKNERREVRSRNEVFTKRASTKIWDEQPSEQNPYIAASCRCYGYDLLRLMEGRSFIDVLFLLFKGELPNRDQAKIFECLLIGMINPGPRHPATRAAMNAGVGKTDTVHILPISLSILGGDHLGAGAIETTMRFFRKQVRVLPEDAIKLLVDMDTRTDEGDWHPVPGFGSRFGGIDEVPREIATYLASLPGAGKALIWGCSFAKELQRFNLGWLSTGVAAAVFSDLGFHPRDGASLFQYVCAPGVLAHGLEAAKKKITAMPFPSDDDYIIEGQEG